MKPDDGMYALRLARKAINLFVKTGEKISLPNDHPESLDEKHGVFVSIYTWPDQKLRGCIGYPEPAVPLGQGLIEVALQACKDPRFHHLSWEEIEKVIVEVSILSRPSVIKVKDPKEYPSRIKIGKDGLIVKRGVFKGLLLPQVALEHDLSAEDFLSEACVKAGLKPFEWQDPKTEIQKFRADVFAEEEPELNLKDSESA